MAQNVFIVCLDGFVDPVRSPGVGAASLPTLLRELHPLQRDWIVESLPVDLQKTHFTPSVLLWFLPDRAFVVLLEALRQLRFEPKERLLVLQGSGLRVSLVPFLNNGLVANRRDSQQSPLSFSEWVGMTTTRLVTTFYNLPSCSSLGWKFLSTSSLKSSGSRE